MRDKVGGDFRRLPASNETPDFDVRSASKIFYITRICLVAGKW